MAFAVEEIVLNMGKEAKRNNGNANSLNAAFTDLFSQNEWKRAALSCVDTYPNSSDTQKQLLFTTKSFPSESESRTFVLCFSQEFKLSYTHLNLNGGGPGI